MKQKLWQGTVGLLSVGAAFAARNAAATVWKRRTGHEPPVEPADPATDMREAVAWTATVALLVGLARLAAHRGAASVWQAVDGDTPPGMASAE